MLTADREILSFRTLAILPLILFLPPLVSFAVAPGAIAFEYVGILYHLAMLFLISRMDAPEWGKAAGFGWITIDVVAGAMLINEVPAEIATPVRLGGHILAGVWIMTASLLTSQQSIRVVGVILGFCLSAYTFVGNVLPEGFLSPTGLLMIVWLGLLAWRYQAA